MGSPVGTPVTKLPLDEAVASVGRPMDGLADGEL